ncbi:hypothetical protein TanjilG_23106 [Lupinus angustifolius]|uniref:non-specific serine/threonine protein kinase n=1 Tax=Lupinus angustifolius TaxID=3871 RepID=A0A1J7GFU4_LUPAN|nr:hypothetical protein TanjilG_23106 [Lupinus angustifolius]
MDGSAMNIGPGMDLPIMHESDRYELVRDIGSGNFGVARLMRDKHTDQLVAVKYIERGQKQVCHRDLKLENTLLDGSPAPRLKICDFGYSKSSVLHSQPKSTVGTPAYIAPEILLKKEYDGKLADVWSCGVTLYVMLVGAYPFEDPDEPKNFRKTIHRITIPEIRNHEWFLKNLPADLVDGNAMNNQLEEPDQPTQSMEAIMQIISEATIPEAGAQSHNQYLTGCLDIDEDMDDDDLESDPDLDIDSSGEIVYAI